MTKMEALLRISLVRAELMQLADAVDPHTRATLTYAARIITLVRPDAVSVVEPEITSADTG